jgi:hypothetical protein
MTSVAPAAVVGSFARTVRTSPFALALVSVLLATTVWTRSHPADADALFEWVSTNIHNLSIAPLRSLVLSAVFLPDEAFLRNAAMLLAVLIPLERRVGSVRTVLVFASAHVIGTVLTEGWEYLAIHAGWLPPTAAFQLDVGVSYGMFGVAAAVCWFLPRRWRRLAIVGLALYLVVPLLVSPGMTTAGHVICLLVGISWWPYLAHRHAAVTQHAAVPQHVAVPPHAAVPQRGAANTPGGNAPLPTAIRDSALVRSTSRSVRSWPRFSQGAAAIRSVAASTAARTD